MRGTRVARHAHSGMALRPRVAFWVVCLCLMASGRTSAAVDHVVEEPTATCPGVAHPGAGACAACAQPGISSAVHIACIACTLASRSEEGAARCLNCLPTRSGTRQQHPEGATALDETGQTACLACSVSAVPSNSDLCASLCLDQRLAGAPLWYQQQHWLGLWSRAATSSPPHTHTPTHPTVLSLHS